MYCQISLYTILSTTAYRKINELCSSVLRCSTNNYLQYYNKYIRTSTILLPLLTMICTVSALKPFSARYHIGYQWSDKWHEHRNSAQHCPLVESIGLLLLKIDGDMTRRDNETLHNMHVPCWQYWRGGAIDDDMDSADA
jgi:hypothetical protein